MTREEVLALRVGLELDKVVSTVVCKFPEPELCERNGEWLHHFMQETYSGSGVLKENRGKMRRLQLYSTDIKAAWPIMITLPMPISISKAWNKAGDCWGWVVQWCSCKGCACERVEYYLCPDEKWVWAITAEEAICRAGILIMLEV